MNKFYSTQTTQVLEPAGDTGPITLTQPAPEIHSPLWWKITKIVLVLGIYALLGYFFFKDFSRLAWHTLELNTGLFIISTFLLLCGLLMEVWVWKRNLQVVGGSITLKNSFKLYYLANLTRYIPGKIWSVLGFIKVGQSASLPPLTTFIGLATGLLSSLISALLLGALLLILSQAQLPPFSLWLAALILLFSIWLLHPLSANLAFRLTAKISGRSLPRLNYTFRQSLKLVGLYILAWIVFSFSFAFLTLSLTDLNRLQFIYTLGVFPLAYALGYLAVFSPGGWGVREGGITLLLSLILPTYLSVAVAILSRLMFTLIEALFFGIALKLKWEKN